MNKDITLEGVTLSLHKAKAEKAVGYDNIPMESFKNDRMVSVLHVFSISASKQGISQSCGGKVS